MVLLHSKMVPLGTPAPDFDLLGIDGERHTLADYARAKVLVVVFMCNHCPYVQKIWDDLVALDKASSAEVQFVGINPNGGNPAYPEDAFDKMKEYAAQKSQEFPYLLDENQEAGRAFEAECTPDFFVYDEARALAYRGAFEGLGSAIDALLKGQAPAQNQSHSMGCSIKWAV